MAGLNPKQTLRNLTKKGFVVNNGADKYLEFWHNGKFVLYTYISQGSKHDIGESLIHKMSSQCLLDKKSFLDLANCPMDKKKYLKILDGKKALQ